MQSRVEGECWLRMTDLRLQTRNGLVCRHDLVWGAGIRIVSTIFMVCVVYNKCPPESQIDSPARLSSRPPLLSLNPFTLHTKPGLMLLVSGQLQTGSRTRVTSGSRRNPSADAPSRSCLLLENPTRLNLYLLTIHSRLGLVYRKIFFEWILFPYPARLYGTDRPVRISNRQN